MNDLKTLIEEQFQKDNFIIQENTQNNSQEKYAVIYCSSNGVYREDSIECFRKTILEIDNYEWYMTRIPYAQKHIFIRDVSKRFYQYGINDKGLENLEKIAEMIKQETQGYKTITIGSSSGGMAAIVLGKILNAEFTISFSPMLKTFKEDMPPEEIAQKTELKEVFDVVEYAKSNIPIFFIYPNGSEWDIYNSSLVADFENVYFLPIKSNVHGVPLNKRLLKEILKADKFNLKNMCKYNIQESVSEYHFALENWGVKMYILRIWDYIKKYPLFFLRKDFYTLVIK